MRIYIDRKEINRRIRRRESIIPKATELKELESKHRIDPFEEINIKCHLHEIKFGLSYALDKKKTYTNLKFYECTFTNCKFSNCIIEECEFVGCTFRDCHFVNVEYIKCIFSKRSSFFLLRYPLICQELDSGSDYFVNCTLTNTEFQKSSCSDIIFTCSRFHSVKIVDTVMKEQLWYRCDIEESKIINSPICGTMLIATKKFDLDFNGDNKSVFDRRTVFDFAKIEITKKRSIRAIRHRDLSNIYGRYDFRKRFLTLTQVSRVFKEIGYTDLAWEYYYIGKKNEKNSFKGVSWLTSSLTDALCGYGERPSHTFICIVFNILLFGLFYLLSGFAIGDKLIDLTVVKVAFPNIIEILKLYCHSVFFSVTTFSTVGYGNYVPVGAISSTLAAIQMLMGIFLTATWTGCIIRKIAR